MEMPDTFSAGDVVRLKSGGPDMTVVYTDPDGDIDCAWFVGEERKSGTFPPAAVETVTR